MGACQVLEGIFVEKAANSLLLPCASARGEKRVQVRFLSAFSPRLPSGCREGDDLSIAVECERDVVDGNAASCRITAAVTGHSKVLIKV